MTLTALFHLAAQLGAARRGIVLAAELRLRGADPETVKTALARHWQAPVRGVYVPHRGPLGPEELAHVAVAHAGPGSVVTGLLAATALGFRWVPDLPGVMVLVAEDVRRVGSEGLVLVRRCAALIDMQTSTWQGVRLASPAQVVVDACRQVLAVRALGWSDLPSAELRRVYERSCLRDIRGLVLGAVADSRCTVAEILEVLEAGSVRDTALIRRACRDALRGAASPPEAELVDDLVETGVPFFCNVEVWQGDVLLAVLDIYLVGTGVGGEMDSKEVHEREDLLDRTLVRHGRVERVGLTLCHVTPNRYRARPQAFIDELFAAVRVRQAQGLGEPTGLRWVPRGPLLRGPRRKALPYPLDPPYPKSPAA